MDDDARAQHFDLCVIGAGTAGYAAADAARALGKSVVIVSPRSDLGGTCIRHGCMPAKTLLASTETLMRVERASDVGVEERDAHVDLAAVIERKRELVAYFAEDRIAALDTFPLVDGMARFVDPETIAVGDRHITARAFLIATGSRVEAAPDSPLREIPLMTIDDVLETTVAPRTLAVIGAGPVGCEFSQYFARLGTGVTLVQAEDEVLRNEDEDLAAVVRTVIEREGVDVLRGSHVIGAREHAGECVLEIATPRGTLTRVVERVLFVGRRVPNVASLDCERGGIALDGGVPRVDATLRTTNPHVWVAGDALGRRCLVHVAEFAGRATARNAVTEAARSVDVARVEAHAVYTQPQIAVTGLTERAASAAGIDVRVARHPFADVGKALVSDEATGFIKLVAAPDGRILGVGIVGDEAIDLLPEGIVAIERGMTASEIAEMPHLHPTMGEIYVRVAERLLESEPVGA